MSFSLFVSRVHMKTNMVKDLLLLIVKLVYGTYICLHWIQSIPFFLSHIYKETVGELFFNGEKQIWKSGMHGTPYRYFKSNINCFHLTVINGSVFGGVMGYIDWNVNVGSCFFGFNVGDYVYLNFFLFHRRWLVYVYRP